MQVESESTLFGLRADLQKTRELYAFEQKKLNDLAMACFGRASSLSSDKAVLEQNKTVHVLIAKIMALKDEIAFLES